MHAISIPISEEKKPEKNTHATSILWCARYGKQSLNNDMDLGQIFVLKTFEASQGCYHEGDFMRVILNLWGFMHHSIFKLQTLLKSKHIRTSSVRAKSRIPSCYGLIMSRLLYGPMRTWGVGEKDRSSKYLISQKNIWNDAIAHMVKEAHQVQNNSMCVPRPSGQFSP